MQYKNKYFKNQFIIYLKLITLINQLYVYFINLTISLIKNRVILIKKKIIIN